MQAVPDHVQEELDEEEATGDASQDFAEVFIVGTPAGDAAVAAAVARLAAGAAAAARLAVDTAEEEEDDDDDDDDWLEELPARAAAAFLAREIPREMRAFPAVDEEEDPVDVAAVAAVDAVAAVGAAAVDVAVTAVDVAAFSAAAVAAAFADHSAAVEDDDNDDDWTDEGLPQTVALTQEIPHEMAGFIVDDDEEMESDEEWVESEREANVIVVD